MDTDGNFAWTRGEITATTEVSSADITVMAPSGRYFGGVETDGARVASTDVPGANPASVVRVALTPGQSQTTVFLR